MKKEATKNEYEEISNNTFIHASANHSSNRM